MVKSNVEAKIVSFNLFGELIIEFNKNMHTDYNITNLNSQISCFIDLQNETKCPSDKDQNLTIHPKLHDLMEIYVEPHNNWNLNRNGFEMQ